MLGWSLEKDNYKEETMFGVASMLCRLGVRPISTSALASRAVANFMAILVCVNYKMDEYLSTYASDPVLTLGAIKVWYELDNGLAKYILPQLQKLILSETLDTGGVGEMVARILLLLAMDKCVLGDGVSPDYKRIGQFVFVSKFLETLGITDIPIRAKGMGDVSAKLKPAFEEWQSKWLNWYVGFTHFVRLSLEPNEDTLWYLLGRRAAGIFPRNQDGADLIIPIFKKCSQTDSGEVQEEVFFILVQVKNRHNDDEFSQAATKKLTPLFVFGDYIEKVETRGEQTPASRTKGTKGTKGPGVNPLSHKPIQDFIRIYINVGDDDTNHFRFLYATALEDNLDLSSNTGDENSETTSSGDAVAGSPESTGEDRAGSNDNQILGEGQRRDGGSTSLEKGRQVGESTGDDLALSFPVFTLCFRSICRATYPFLKREVATRLASMVETWWNPLALVKGGLTHRAEEDGMKKPKVGASKVILSNLVSRKELEKTATIALVLAPGFDRKTAKPSQDILVKRARTQAHQKVSKRVKREY